MLISLLVAASENNVIGRNNALPWHLPNDLAYFKNTTWGMPVIMGRKTYESFNQHLAGRTNIVITRQEGWRKNGIIVKGSLDEALEAAAEMDVNEVFVIGGGEIFREVFDRADRVYLTRVHADVEGDTFFPEISETGWRLKSSRRMEKDDRHAYAYSFQVWERKK